MSIRHGTKSVATKAPAKRFSVYVIGLNKLVLKERKFLAANPQYNPARPCVYVGMTGLSPRHSFLIFIGKTGAKRKKKD